MISCFLSIRWRVPKFVQVPNATTARAAILAGLLGAGAYDAGAQQERALGLDISAWQGNISQTTWNNIRTNENRRFIILRSSRGGTTGYYNQNDASNSQGLNTLSQRYDDPYFVQNINRVPAAGMFAGSYHFSRPDIIESTLNSGGIRNNGSDEADHFIQMAGAWMRPGYLVPVHDLEAGISQRTATELIQFAIDFSNRTYAQMGIRPAIYIGGNYANYIAGASASLRNQLAQPSSFLPTMTSPGCSVLWSARWPNQNDPNSIDVQNGHPKDSYTPIYGPWDDYGVTHPWSFWQYASTGRLQSFNNGGSNLDLDVANGGIEFLKDLLVPALWMNDSDGQWTTLANWNSGQTPVAPVTGPGQVTPVGIQTLPTPRLPGAAGSGVTSGQNDTVILERPNANIVVTLSSGTHDIRKLYMREALNITGGSLNINYIQSWDSTVNGAQFSGPVTMSGTASLSVHTLQVDTNQTFTLSGGTLTFDTINLMPHGTFPAKIAVTGDINFNALSNATALITNVGGTGSIDLSGGNRSFNVGDGSSEVDLSINVPISNGGLTKTGSGTLRLRNANTYGSGTTISAGKLLVNNSTGSGTGTGSVAVNGGTLAGTGTIGGVVTVNSGGTISPGTASAIGILTLNSTPTFIGTNLMRIDRNGGSPLADKLVRSGGALNYGGTLVVTNVGTTLLGGEVFTNFSASSYSGAFSATNLPALSGDLNWYLGNLTVNGTIRVNRKPVVNGFTLTNTPGQVLQISKASLVGSATDADGDSLALASFDSTTTNGIVLSSDSTFIYYSNSANVADKFNYTISDGRGGSTTGVAQIAISSSTMPSITSQPQSSTVIAGQNAILSVSATGTQPLSYQWKKGPISLSNGGNVSGATSATLTLGNVSPSDTASYTVVITNSLGSITSSVAMITVHYSLTVTVNGPGSVSKDPAASSFAPNTEVIVTATPNTNAMFVNWGGDEVGTENPLTVTMNANKTIVANFVGAGSVDDIIIDNNNVLATFTGNWQTGTSSSDKFGSDYYFASTVSGGTSNATYQPLILTGGNYDVYVWYPQGGNRPTNAPWSIVYDGGSTNVPVNQTTNGGKWVLITSARPFAVGTSGYVRLSNNAELSKVVMADAVKFVYSAVQGQAPIITSQPQSQSVVVGQNATFNVSVMGDPPSYQWRFNGTNISGAITSSYTRSNCQPADAGGYSVVVTNASGSVTSSVATLTVNVPPSITTHPQSRTVVAGSNVVFTISANGDAPLNYQWRFNEANISGATSSGYTVVNAQSGDAGNYSVVVTNAYGTATSDDAALVVNVPPAITTQPQSQAVVQSSNVTFNVIANGTEPLNYQWRFNNNPISGATASSYTRANIQPADAGNYSVVITNIAGTTTSADAALTVNIPPSITTGPVGQSVGQGSNAVFSVVASGTGSLSYQWRFNGDPISGATTSGYTRASAQTTDAGPYAVVVSNAYGSATSANAILTVIVPPSIITQPQGQTATVNQSVTFNVEVAGTAPLSYQWRLNEEDILDATDSEFFIANAQLSDAGNYSVVITNSAGNVTSSTAVLSFNAAPVIATHPVSRTNSFGTMATFTVEAVGNGLTYQWQKGGVNLLNQGDISGATLPTLTIATVAPADVGAYRVIVQDVNESSVFSSNATLTLEGTETNKPTVSFTSPSQTSVSTITLTGTAKDTGVPLGVVAEVWYRLHPEPNFSQAILSGKNWHVPNVALTPGTNQFYAYAVDSSGNCSLTNSKVILYDSTSWLTVNIIGGGLVKNASGLPVSNGQQIPLLVGRPSALTAYIPAGTPATNYVFSNWFGTITNTNAALKFIMESNMTLTAHFIPNPFLAVAGQYNGLFQETNGNGVSHRTAGYLTFKLSGKSTYSGKVFLDGNAISLSGKFDLSGRVNRTVLRAAKFGKSDLSLDLALDWSTDSQMFSGTIGDETFSSEIIGDRAGFSLVNPATNFVGRYTMILPRGGNFPTTSPGGFGYALITNKLDGTIGLSGRLGDNTIISQSVPLSKDGKWPLYVPLYKNTNTFVNGVTLQTATNKADMRGSLFGWVDFTSLSNGPTGTLSWIKTAVPTTNNLNTNYFYTAGFSNDLGIISSPYNPPPSGTRILQFTNANLTLAHGNLATPVAWSASVKSNNAVTVVYVGADKVTLTLNAKTGFMSGKIFHPNNNNLLTSFYGAVLQHQNYAAGEFPGRTDLGSTTNQSGSVLFQGND